MVCSLEDATGWSPECKCENVKFRGVEGVCIWHVSSLLLWWGGGEEDFADGLALALGENVDASGSVVESLRGRLGHSQEGAASWALEASIACCWAAHWRRQKGGTRE